MDILRVENKPLSTSCYAELNADYSVHQETNFEIHDSTDEEFLTLEGLTKHLNEGILISSETFDAESHFDVSDNDGGLLLVWGCGEFGQHGHGHQNDVSIAVGTTNPLILGQDGLVDLVACGSSHTIVATDDNRIFSWGNCNSGQLGIGDTRTTLQPHLVQLGVKPGTRIRGMICGTRHTFIWTEEGDCFSFGNNFSAQLGYDFRKPDFKENQPRPVYLETLFNQKIYQVACGSRHSLFLFTSGSVASVGSNDRGQLGHSDKIDSVCIQKVVDVQNVSIIGCGNCHCLAADRDGNLYAWGYGKACGSKEEDILSPIMVYRADDSTSVTGLVGGDSHSLILLGNGKLMSWGNNFEGQLGQDKSVKFLRKPTKIKDGLLEEKVINISAGENTSAAVTESGRLFMWGKNVSQVICEDEGPRYCQYEPHPVALGKWKATKVACGAWHVACIVSPDARPNTWDWTPPLVNIPDNSFEMEQYTEDVSVSDKSDSQKEDQNIDLVNDNTKQFDESNDQGEEDQNVEDFVDEDNGQGYNIVDSNAELTVQTETNNAMKDPIDHIKKKTTLSDWHIEKDSLIMDTNTKLDVQSESTHGTLDLASCVENEMPLSAEKRDAKISSEANNLAQKASRQRHSLPERNRLPEGDHKKKKNRLPETDRHTKQRNHLRRTTSEESVNCNIKSQARPHRISKSLCNIEVEQGQDERKVSPERRSSTGAIRSTSRIHSRSALNRNNESPFKSTESLSSANTSLNIGTDQNTMSQSKQRASSIGTRNLPLPDTQFNVSSREVTGQLNRQKKAPRHLRRAPTVPRMEYCLPNQPIQSCDVKEDFHQPKYVQKTTINRSHSSPNIISNHQSDIHAITLSIPSTPPSSIRIPHPPPTDALPPKHPRFRKQPHSQKIVFSSGSSWRKRNSKI